LIAVLRAVKKVLAEKKKLLGKMRALRHAQGSILPVEKFSSKVREALKADS
jgi:hypothetical protein